jgi:tRNA(fMet)-specific endonuclease VapC
LVLKPILIDTNAYSAFQRAEPEAVQVVQTAASVHISATVLGELIAGFVVGSKLDANRAGLVQFLTVVTVEIHSIDEKTAEVYGSVYSDLRRLGKLIPTNDMWIAATAIQHALCLFTYDAHFKSVSGLTTASTIAELTAP